MKGFASTIVFAGLLSIFILLNAVDNNIYSSMLAQKESIVEMQHFNERIYSMQDGFKKTVEDANKDMEKKVLDFSGKTIKLSTGENVDYLDEAYICYKIDEWAYENNYSVKVVFVNPFDLRQEEASEKIVLKKKQYSSLNSKVKKQTNGLLSLENVLICTAFLNSKGGVVEVGLNENLPIDFKSTGDLLSEPFAFSINSSIAGQEASALILGGEEI